MAGSTVAKYNKSSFEVCREFSTIAVCEVVGQILGRNGKEAKLRGREGTSFIFQKQSLIYLAVPDVSCG